MWRSNHLDCYEGASRRSSSRATGTLWLLRWTNSSGRFIFERSGRDSHTCRSCLPPQIHWIEFAEMVLHLRVAISSLIPLSPLCDAKPWNILERRWGDIGFLRFATYFLEMNSETWPTLITRGEIFLDENSASN